jgi:regulatory protein
MKTSKITDLKTQKRNKQRVSIYLDGEYAFRLSRIVAAWLRVGQELTEEDIEKLKGKETAEATLQQALRFLNYRTRSEAEVRRNLEEHQFPEEYISETLERLRQNGLLNDHQFAQTWVENRSTFRPRSRKALSIELRKRGLADHDIAEAVENIDDEKMAYQAALKHAHKLPDDDWTNFRQKMIGFLARRGFDYYTASNTAERIWQEVCNDQD